MSLSTRILLTFALVAAPAEAQVVTGRVFMKDAPDQSVASAEVTVQQDSFFARTVADGKGRFSLHVNPGKFTLTIQALGFQKATSEQQLKQSQRLIVEVPMTATPTEVSAVVVKARMAIKTGREGFAYRYDRGRKSGIGMFLTDEDIAKRPAIYISDAIGHLPFMRSSQAVRSARGPTSFTSTPIQHQGPARTCGSSGFQYYIDGTRTLLDAADVDSFIQVSDVAGIEVYRSPEEVPGEFNTGNGCAVIVIWTK